MVTAFIKRNTPDAGRIERAAFDSMSSLVTGTASLPEVPVAELISTPSSSPIDIGILVGQVFDIPLKKLIPNPLNARALYSIGAASTLLESMEIYGQETAVTGYIEGANVSLIDGHRRFKAAESLGWDTLRVEIRPKPASDKALYLASWTANKKRDDQTALDDALVWRRLLDLKVFLSQADLARATGVSETEVSRTLSLATLPAQVVQALSEQPDLLKYKMLNAIREFEQVHGINKTLALIVDVATNSSGYREVESRRKVLLAEPRQRETPVARNVRFHSANGTIKQFSKDGRVELVLKGLSDEDAKTLIANLEKMLNSSK